VIPSHRISLESRVFRSVLGFYRSAEHAEEALHAARKNHFRRSAAVHRAEDGRLKFFHAGLAPRDRAAFGIAVALVVALLSEILRTRLWALVLLPLSGFLITWFGTLWLGFGIKRGFLRHYSRFAFVRQFRRFVMANEIHLWWLGSTGRIAWPSCCLRNIVQHGGCNRNGLRPQRFLHELVRNPER
jgi:hypothetical protein